MNAIFQTEPNLAFIVLRLGLAVTFFAHGTQHLFGWLGGRGLMGQVGNWKERYRIPIWIGIVGVFTEILSVPAMILGLLVRPLALGLMIFLAVAIWASHWEHGFFLSGGGRKGMGIEYCLALFLMALTILVGGAGALSIDQMLSR